MTIQAIDLDLSLLGAFTKSWLEEVKGSRTTLTAAFNALPWGGPMKETCKRLEKALAVEKPAFDVLPNRITRILDKAEKEGYDIASMDNWKEARAKMASISGQKAGYWQGLKLARQCQGMC